MYCTNCGIAVEKDALFCGKCGRKLPAKVADINPQPPSRPRVWNPKVVVAWSVVFTPAFGSCLVAANWKAIGRADEYRFSLAWLAASIVVLLSYPVLGGMYPDGYSIEAKTRGFGIVYLILWYFASARAQVRTFSSLGRAHYETRSWTFPLCAAVLSTIAYVFMSFGIGFLAGILKEKYSSIRTSGTETELRIQSEPSGQGSAVEATVEALDPTIHGKWLCKSLANGAEFYWEFKLDGAAAWTTMENKAAPDSPLFWDLREKSVLTQRYLDGRYTEYFIKQLDLQEMILEGRTVAGYDPVTVACSRYNRE